MAHRNVRRPAHIGLVPLVMAGVLALTACSAAADPPAAGIATATAEATVEATVEAAGVGPGSAPPIPASSKPAGSKPATGKPATVLADGRHTAYLTQVDTGGRTVTFDKVEILTGEAARKRHQEQNPGETDGPPNDYVLVNDNKLKRTMPVADPVDVAVIDTGSGDSANPVAGSFKKLPAFLADKDNSTLFTLTVHNGKITSLTSMYLP